MAEKNQVVEAKSDKKNRPKIKPPVVEELTEDLAYLSKLPGGPMAVSGDGTIEGQAARLSDARLQTAQHQAMAAQIGRVQGNRHLQRVVGFLKRDEYLPQPAPRPDLNDIQRDPDPNGPIVIQYGNQRLTFDTRDDLARFLAAIGTLTNGLAQDLAERDQYFFHRVTEQARSLVTTINLRVVALALATSNRTIRRLALSVLNGRDSLLQDVREAEEWERRHRARRLAEHARHAARRMEQQRTRLLQQMHRAFRAKNTSLIEQISGAYGKVGSLINEATTFYDNLRRWDGRSALGISVLTNYLNRAMSVVNFFSGLGNEIPGLASPTERALGSLTLALNTASTVTTLLNVSPTMYGILTAHIGPALSAICSGWARVENQMRRQNDIWYQLYGEEAVNWNVEPGGRPVHNYLQAVFRASGPTAVPAIPNDVGQFFLDHRSILNAAMRAMGIEEMPTERVLWILWHRIQQERFKGWIFHNRQMVWRLIYGTERPFPTARPAAR